MEWYIIGDIVLFELWAAEVGAVNHTDAVVGVLVGGVPWFEEITPIAWFLFEDS